MSVTITGKLNKAATIFSAGDSTGFGLRLGVKYYDRETKADAYTNYEVAVFAKAPAQVEFYKNTLAEGAIVEVSGDKQRIKQYQGANGLILSIEILDAKVGFVFNPQVQPKPQAQQQPQPQYNQPQQGYAQPQPQPQQRRQPPPANYQGQMPQQPQQQYSSMNPPIDFDDDIPFN